MRKIIFTTAIIAAIATVSAGCAQYQINQDGSVTTRGFFRNLAVKNEYYESGTLKSSEVKSESTTRDIMLGTNELLDTASQTYAKLKP